MDPANGYQTAPQQSPPRSVAHGTWGKKGVTAKQRQAAARAARLDPLSPDEYQRQQAMVSGTTTPGSNSGRLTMDPAAEQNFVRRHLGIEQQQQQPPQALQPTELPRETDMAPHSPLLHKTESRSVKHFWSTTAPIPAPSFGESDSLAVVENAAPPTRSPKPAVAHISRSARSKQLFGEEAVGTTQPAAGIDQTAQVAEVLQTMRARHDAQRRQFVNSEGPDEESAALSPSERDQAAVAPSRQSMEDERADAAAAAAATAAASSEVPPVDPAGPLPPSVPAAEPGLCTACLPCLGVTPASSTSCWGTFAHTLDRWFGTGGGGGREAALREMRQGVILPKDAQKVDEAAVAEVLRRFQSPLGDGKPPVFQARIRRTDELRADSSIVHPMVRMHILDLRTGAYWPKRDKKRHAVAPYENLRHSSSGGAGGGGEAESAAYERILPILTQPYALKSRGSFLPKWDENLLVNEPLAHLLDPHCIVIFEIVDFGRQVDLRAHPSGYYPIAWAFLKTVSTRGEPNLGLQQTLQLYHYTNFGTTPVASRDTVLPFATGGLRGAPAPFKKAGVPDVYYEYLWQKHCGRVRYPSVFYVDLVGVPPPAPETVRGARPYLPTQIEEGRLGFVELLAQAQPAVADEYSHLDATTAAGRRTRAAAVAAMSPAQKAALVRRRQPMGECLVPNNPVHAISAGATGCFVLRYSPDGRTLAAACGDGLMFTVKLYDSDTGAQLFTYVGHHELIYDLAWNCLGTEIITASADGTAKVWQVDTTRALPAHLQRAQALATLQHTGYVYTCAFHPKPAERHIILTGGFDGVLRIWNNRGDLLHLIADAHATHINSVVFAPNGTRIFSGDADGIVKVFEDTNYTRATAAAATTTDGGNVTEAAGASWESRIRCLHTIANDDLKGHTITCIRYHPRPERLAVYCRDNSIYLFSLLRYEVRQVLTGIPCHHHTLRCAISPDGDKLVAGGEDGQAYFYDLTQGDFIKVLDVGFYNTPLYDVTWHPTQHAVAFASFGADLPIKVFEYNAAKEPPPPVRLIEDPTAPATGGLASTTNALAQSQRPATMRMSTRDPLPPLHIAGGVGSLPVSSGTRPPLSTTVAGGSRSTRPPFVPATINPAELDATATGLGASKRVHFTRQ